MKGKQKDFLASRGLLLTPDTQAENIEELMAAMRTNQGLGFYTRNPGLDPELPVLLYTKG